MLFTTSFCTCKRNNINVRSQIDDLKVKIASSLWRLSFSDLRKHLARVSERFLIIFHFHVTSPNGTATERHFYHQFALCTISGREHTRRSIRPVVCEYFRAHKVRFRVRPIRTDNLHIRLRIYPRAPLGKLIFRDTRARVPQPQHRVRTDTLRVIWPTPK